MASYSHRPEFGYEHGVIVHDHEFVNSEDTSVHTQNIEVHNQWTKAGIKSYKGSNPLNSYCVEYSSTASPMPLITLPVPDKDCRKHETKIMIEQVSSFTRNDTMVDIPTRRNSQLPTRLETSCRRGHQPTRISGTLIARTEGRSI